MFDFEIYSPEEEIKLPLLQQKAIKWFIKRDDLIHPFISGNKWRKLKYNLEKATLSKKNHLISFGGAYSNHILALAAAGAKFGFKTTAFIRGEEVKNEMLRLCQIFGMQLIFVTREAYQYKRNLYNTYFSDEKDTFFIDEGGAGKDAEKGCREIINELKQHYDYIFCAAGTGTTAAGIINSIIPLQHNTSFHVVPVLKGYEILKNDINNLLDNSYNYHIQDNYHFGGYAKTKPELINFIKYFASETGILTDPVYTGKVAYCIHDLIQKDFFPPNSKILMIHTGGLFGILGMLDRF